MKSKLILTTSLSLVACNLLAQELPSGLRISNQMEYSYGTLERELEDIENRETFENWMNINYTRGIFSTSFRFDTFQPFDDADNPVLVPDHVSTDLAFKNIGIKAKRFELEVGNYYVLLGRGLLLSSYEQRDIRFDNNLEGVKTKFKHDLLELTALTGSPEDENGERNDILHAGDLEIKIPSEYLFGQRLNYGFTVLSNQFQAQEGTEFQRLIATSNRAELTSSYFDFYGEYGNKQNTRLGKATLSDSTNGNPFYQKGSGLYLSGVVTTEFASLSAEWKDYDNFRIAPSNVSSEFYNTPPSVIRQHSYTLLNRHPLRLDQNNEKGYQLELTIFPTEKAVIVLNTSQTKNQDSDSEFAKRFRISERENFAPGATVWEEIYGHVNYEFSDEFVATLGFSKAKELVSSNTETLTPVFEFDWAITEESEIHLGFEHQQIKHLEDKSKSLDQLLTLEYTAHGITFSLLSEMLREKELTNNNTSSKTTTHFWNFGQMAFNLWGNHDLTLGYGSRQGGFVCIGGVCREEPPFKGFEAKLISRF